MGFRLVSKSVTLNDHERRNGRYSALFQRIRVASVAHCVKVHVRCQAVSSPDEFLFHMAAITNSHMALLLLIRW